MEYSLIEQDCQTVQSFFHAERETEVDEAAKAASRIAQACHEASAEGGWWSEEAVADPDLFWKKVALIHSEIAEATEGARKGVQDDKLPQFTMFEAELADTIIRTADLLGRFGTLHSEGPEFGLKKVGFAYVDQSPHNLVGYAVGQPGADLSRLHYHASKIFGLAWDLRNEIDKNSQCYYDRAMVVALSRLLMACFETCEAYGLSIGNVIATKMQFNAERDDHKPENRKKAGGKKW